jgi:hypothetical protein
MKDYYLPISASILAIGVTTYMDFSGYFLFSALPLFLITLIFWLIQKQSLIEIGLQFGMLSYYTIAVLYPIFVLGAAFLIAFLFGDISINFNARKDILNLSAGLLTGPIMLLITEEGFFRDWLWGAFKKSGSTPKKNFDLFIYNIHFLAYISSNLGNRLWLTLVSGSNIFSQCISFVINLGYNAFGFKISNHTLN